MISKVKLGLAERKNAPQKDNSRRRTGPLKSIGLILDVAGLDKKHAFLAFIEKFGLKNKDFEVILCPNPKEEHGHEGLVFTISDLSLTGKIKNQQVKEFVDREFDLLISYCQSEGRASQFLMRTSNAYLKAGRDKGSVDLYDLSIASEFEEVAVFLNELEKYLEILRK